MADATTLVGDPVDSALKIPAETAQKFSEIVSMVQKSASMNHDERQYWIDALPVMTDEQLKTLRDILTNEKKQIETANETYQKKAPKPKSDLDYDPETYKKKKEEIKAKEAEAEEAEKSEEAKILEEIQKM